MAYTKTVWTNDSGQPLNDTNLNKMEQGIKDAHTGSIIKGLYEAEADTNAFTDAEKALIATNATGISTNDTRLDNLEDTGMTVLSGSSIASQTIAVTPTKVNAFDTVEIDVGVGTSGDATLDRATADSDGVFKLRFEAFVEYAGNIDMTWQMYKNGVAFGNSITLAGQGANKPFPIILITTVELVATDYLELYATASSSASLDIIQSNATIEKTHF